MKKTSANRDTDDLVMPPPVDEVTPNAAAWELVEAGRYRPRRIKGSCVGRELG